ncbi:MAG TPA: hypothetical protein VKP88_04215 [Candidatus Paceibacterota bacterium]|nr:hypothetical protein [Candidatus Paceibacterota bacterium]
MQTDVKAVRVTAASTPSIQAPARIKGIVATASGGAGRLTITDGSGGATLVDLDVTSGSTIDVMLPGEGVLAADSIVVSAATNIAGATIFYG